MSQKRVATPTSRRAQRRVAEQQARNRRRLMMVGGAAAVAILIAAILVMFARPDDDQASERPITIPPARDGSIPQNGRTLGDPDAPVTIVEYADFQCPACGQFALTVEPRLVSDYIQTGKAKLVYHDFPFLDDRVSGNESDLASEAAFAAQGQGRFWDFHDTLYANQSGENDGAFSKERLTAMAEELGLDVESFTAALDDGTYADDVQALYDESITRGITSTPTFEIDGQIIIGADYEAIERAIAAATGDE